MMAPLHPAWARRRGHRGNHVAARESASNAHATPALIHHHSPPESSKDQYPVCDFAAKTGSPASNAGTPIPPASVAVSRGYRIAPE